MRCGAPLPRVTRRTAVGRDSVDALFVVNPAAGGGRGRDRFERVRALAAAPGKVIEVHMTSAAGEATTVARDAARAGWRAVVAVGGDGTASEVAAGLIGSDTALGIVSTGTGCDFVRTAGIPGETEPAMRALWTYAPRPVDMGRIGDRPFLNAAGLGFDAAVADEANRIKHGGSSGGTWTYLQAVSVVLRRFRGARVQVCVDDGPAEDVDLLMTTFANGRCYAGGMRISPASSLDDGALEMVLVRALRPAQVVLLLPTVFVGQHLRHRAVSVTPFRRLRLTARDAVPLHCDGESLTPLAAGASVDLRVEPAAIRLLAPPKAS